MIIGKCRRFLPVLSQFVRNASSQCSAASSNLLERFIRDKIRSGGPITVHEYMALCSGSAAGYYGHSELRPKESFTSDFITSPELSQVFGEMIGIWIINELLNTGYQGPWQLVELGPGTGTFMKDILQMNNLSVHLVEVSQTLTTMQRKKLISTEFANVVSTSSGVPLHWHKTFDEVPKDKFTVFIANEFFDALPIHQFSRNSEGKWREVYVTLDKSGENFCFMLSRSENIHTKTLLPEYVRDNNSRNHWELSPRTITTALAICDRITSHGGFFLTIDYGHDGSRLHPSLRAYKEHKLVDPLTSPGEVDITADVDFGYLRTALADKCLTFGPIEQKVFLSELGVDYRIRQLLEQCKTAEEKEALTTSFKMIMDDDAENGMGTKFKAFSMFPNTLQNIIRMRGGAPPGFLSSNLI
ncbi:putative s-adenosyl-L-methionine-dependent methyltransferase domain-containing protein [Ditylenchus destructor]|uniref:Protein arginine methyltransferase NDUFAF7 n=1 Tax=Ditylenchus destructor TaxID=166010 RepID=A0AAD4NCH0_9BILA|nr:putative s-adenosyl-L-methionine-dependent methyltransferase domain-containing protein [Ditylenchus destructor]